jgi:hypothetical protein
MDNPQTYGGVPVVSPNELAYKSPAPPITQAAQVEINDSKSTAQYANFCHLSGMPEELLIDFGLHPQPMEIATQSVMLTQPAVVGWHTAKRLLHVLQLTVDRHESAFGAIETDVQKRIRRT